MSIKVLYIITQADGGGAQKYVLALAKHFRGAIAAGQEAQKLFDDAKAARLTVYPLKHLKRNIHPWHDFWAVWEIRNLIKNLKPDIVHLNSTKAGILGSFASIGLRQSMPRTDWQGWSGARVVFTAHGFRFNEPLSYPSKKFYLALEKVASCYRDFIITVSNADRESALKNKLIDKNKIKTIHNGLAPINFLPRDDARKALGLPLDKFIFGTIANFYKTKGLDVLIKTVATLGEDIKSRCMFVIIGDGKEFKNLKLKIKNLKLERHLSLPGNLPDANRYLKAFNAFILPSRKEGFPFTILEAMQAGLPIIASKVGGIPEALEDAGLQIPVEDAKALANAIASLLDDANLAAKFAREAKDRSQLFSEDKMLSETEKVYQNLFLR